MQVYSLAQEALLGVQQALEARLKPPQQVQDALYSAKDGLPVPPDPIKKALDAFAQQALGDLGEHPARQHHQTQSTAISNTDLRFGLVLLASVAPSDFCDGRTW